MSKNPTNSSTSASDKLYVFNNIEAFAARQRRRLPAPSGVHSASGNIISSLSICLVSRHNLANSASASAEAIAQTNERICLASVAASFLRANSKSSSVRKLAVRTNSKADGRLSSIGDSRPSIDQVQTSVWRGWPAANMNESLRCGDGTSVPQLLDRVGRTISARSPAPNLTKECYPMGQLKTAVMLKLNEANYQFLEQVQRSRRIYSRSLTGDECFTTLRTLFHHADTMLTVEGKQLIQCMCGNIEDKSVSFDRQRQLRFG